MTKKIDKIQRQKSLLDSINSDSYNKEEFMAKFHIRERTIRRDLEDLAESGEIHRTRLSLLRKKCLGKLAKKVHDGQLDDKYMVQIVLSGEPKRIEAKTTEEIKIEQTVKIDATEDEDKILSRAAAILTRKRRFGAVH
ncbi:MAG: DeoR family transcriptional regulator [Candidatus Bathyarchaeota archaeon]|nr:DeoR family transcriptional regulator [Candidatus Bathyarchaeota archaeon]